VTKLVDFTNYVEHALQPGQLPDAFARQERRARRDARVLRCELERVVGPRRRTRRGELEHRPPARDELGAEVLLPGAHEPDQGLVPGQGPSAPKNERYAGAWQGSVRGSRTKRARRRVARWRARPGPAFAPGRRREVSAWNVDNPGAAAAVGQRHFRRRGIGERSAAGHSAMSSAAP
jgi:hypothetical protein